MAAIASPKEAEDQTSVLPNSISLETRWALVCYNAAANEFGDGIDMRRTIQVWVVSALLFSIAGWAAESPSIQVVGGITNFGRVNAGLFRGAQPDGRALQTLARLGIKSIIDLRLTNEVAAAEAVLAGAAGITYTNVPLPNMSRPTDRQVAQVLSFLESAPAPVFIHCMFGSDRTGTIIACYRIQHDRWSGAQALKEADQYGMAAWEVDMKQFVLEFAKKRQAR
jgi:tyrosine-protein phosphatase SIW14